MTAATIRQIADEMGTTRDRVRHAARKHGLQPTGRVRTEQGIWAHTYDHARLTELVLRSHERYRANTDTIEDVAWLAESGETADAVCRRLGTSWDTLSQMLRRYERTDLLQRLVRNSHARGLTVTGELLQTLSGSWAA